MNSINCRKFPNHAENTKRSIFHTKLNFSSRLFIILLFLKKMNKNCMMEMMATGYRQTIDICLPSFLFTGMKYPIIRKLITVRTYLQCILNDLYSNTTCYLELRIAKKSHHWLFLVFCPIENEITIQWENGYYQHLRQLNTELPGMLHHALSMESVLNNTYKKRPRKFHGTVILTSLMHLCSDSQLSLDMLAAICRGWTLA